MTPTALTTSTGIIVDLFVEQLCELVSGRGGTDHSTQSTRDKFVVFLNNFPLLNRTCAEAIRNDNRYAALLFYERTRCGAATTGYFLEAVPSSLTLTTGDFVVGKFGVGYFKTTPQSRAAKIKELESGEKKDSDDAVPARFLNDIPKSLPLRVHQLISYCRANWAHHRTILAEHYFGECNNHLCKRATISCIRTGAKPALLEYSHETATYWNLINPKADLRRPASNFCSSLCRKRYQDELESFYEQMPSFEELDADTGRCCKSGRQRVFEALRLAGKRNEKVGRMLRNPSLTDGYSALHVGPYVDMLIMKLNVDFALLYAASQLAESRTLSADRVLPATRDGWRSRPHFYAMAIRKIKALYPKYYRSGHIISNALVDEAFLRKVGQVAASIF